MPTHWALRPGVAYPCSRSCLMPLKLDRHSREETPNNRGVLAAVAVVNKEQSFRINIKKCTCPAYQTDTEQNDVWTPGYTGAPSTCGPFTHPVDVVYINLLPRTS